MNLHVLPEGLVAASGEIEAITTRLLAAHAAAAPAITAVIPPAVDPVSLRTAVEFNVQAEQHQMAAGEGAAELGRGASGVASTAASYTEGDELGATVYATEL